jgi:hypothetical protein
MKQAEQRSEATGELVRWMLRRLRKALRSGKSEGAKRPSARLFYLTITRLHRVTRQPEHEVRGAGRCMD